MTEEEEYDTLLKEQLVFLDGQAAEYPAGHSMFLLAKLLYENPPEHITVVLKEAADLEAVKKKLPFLVNVSVRAESEDHPLLNDKTTYYVCKNHACLPPVNEL